MGNIHMHHKSCTLSIAMTTYNGEAFLRQQLDSIYMQSYQDFELIVCDDGSSDNTIDILNDYKSKHQNIKIYQNETQLGSVKNFEHAIDVCTSDYIALCDQDDIWKKEKLEKSIKEMHILEKMYPNTPLMIHSDLAMINENNTKITSSYFTFRNYQLKKEKDLAFILGPCGVMGNTIVMNRLLKEIILPFPKALAVHDYWIALINELYGKRLTLKDPLVQYRIHQKNLSNSITSLETTFMEKIQKSFTLNFSLPHMEIERNKVLHYLLKHYTLDGNDKKLISQFISYLERKENPIVTFYHLLRYNFVKRGFWYRYALLIKLLFTRRYR